MLNKSLFEAQNFLPEAKKNYKDMNPLQQSGLKVLTNLFKNLKTFAINRDKVYAIIRPHSKKFLLSLTLSQTINEPKFYLILF